MPLFVRFGVCESLGRLPSGSLHFVCCRLGFFLRLFIAACASALYVLSADLCDPWAVRAFFMCSLDLSRLIPSFFFGKFCYSCARSMITLLGHDDWFSMFGIFRKIFPLRFLHELIDYTDYGLPLRIERVWRSDRLLRDLVLFFEGRISFFGSIFNVFSYDQFPCMLYYVASSLSKILL